jgi:hypothetical protein
MMGDGDIFEHMVDRADGDGVTSRFVRQTTI